MNNLGPIARSVIRSVDDRYGPWWGAVMAHAIADAPTPAALAETLADISSLVNGSVPALKVEAQDNG